MGNMVVKMVAKRAKQQAKCHVGTLLFWVFLNFLGTNFALTSLAHADDLSREMIKQLVVQHAHETRHVDATLALGGCRGLKQNMFFFVIECLEETGNDGIVLRTKPWHTLTRESSILTLEPVLCTQVRNKCHKHHKINQKHLERFKQLV